MYISIPIKIEKDRGIRMESDVKTSIASFLDMMVSSPRGVCRAEPDFGFVLKNFRFENVNEMKGVLYSPSNVDADSPYSYKIQGKSTNGQKSFALQLKKNIERFEPRLKNVKVKMEYEQVSKIVVLTITGQVVDIISEKFEHVIKIHVW